MEITDVPEKLVIATIRQLKSHGHGSMTVKVESGKIVGIDKLEKNRVR